MQNIKHRERKWRSIIGGEKQKTKGKIGFGEQKFEEGERKRQNSREREKGRTKKLERENGRHNGQWKEEEKSIISSERQKTKRKIGFGEQKFEEGERQRQNGKERERENQKIRKRKLKHIMGGAKKKRREKESFEGKSINPLWDNQPAGKQRRARA